MSQHVDPGATGLGARIRDARRAAGLSQAELGEPQFSGSYISHIEKGRRTPTVEVLEHIARRLAIPVWQLDPRQSDESLDVELAARTGAARLAHFDKTPVPGLELATSASNLAHQLGRLSRAWEADLLCADFLTMLGRYDESAQLAMKLARSPIVAAHPQLRAQASTLAARAYRACRRLEDALCAGRLAVRDAAEAGSKRMEAAANIIFLVALAELDQMDEVESVIAHLLQIVGQCRPETAAEVHWAVGNMRFLQGDPAEGARHLQEGIELCDPRVNLPDWARIRLAFAYNVARHGGDVMLAHKMVGQAAEIVTLIGTPSDRADLLITWGWMCWRTSDWVGLGGAIDHLQELVPSLDYRAKGDVAELLGEVHFVRSNLPAAREAWQQAAHHFELARAPRRALMVRKRCSEVASRR